MGFEVLDEMALKADGTFGWRECAGNNVKQGGFTRAIGADDGFNDAAFNLKVEVDQRRQAAKGHHDIFYLKDILCSQFVQRGFISSTSLL